jgi:IS30 family transposase
VARLTNEDRENILADWHTGQYSHSELGKRYNTSHVTIGKICKGIEPKHADKVTAQIAIKTALVDESYKEVTAIAKAVDEKTRHLQFLHNATLKNVSVMSKKINEDMSVAEHKMAQETIHKAGQSLGVIDQFAKSGDVNVSTVAAIQNNTVKTLSDFYDG